MWPFRKTHSFLQSVAYKWFIVKTLHQKYGTLVVNILEDETKAVSFFGTNTLPYTERVRKERPNDRQITDCITGAAGAYIVSSTTH